MAEPNPAPDSDIDGAWKEAFNEYLQAFFALCLPEVHADIDWSRGFEFLDKELQKIAPQSETGRRSVDLLIRVWRRKFDRRRMLWHRMLGVLIGLGAACLIMGVCFVANA